MLLKTSLFFICIILFYVPLCFAQSKVDTLEYLAREQTGNKFFSNFNKVLNTFYLNTGFNLFGQYSGLTINLNENFRSSLFRSTTQSTRDEQYFGLTGKYKITKGFDLGLSASSIILSDNRNIQLNQATTNYLSLFSNIHFSNDISFSPFGGYTSNQQLGATDTGPLYGFEGLMTNLKFPDFTISSNFKFRNEDILPRRNLIRYFDLSLVNPFNNHVTNFITGSYSSIRKDFYFPADSITSSVFDVINNIESRTENIFYAEDRLRYNNFIKNIDLEILGGVKWRTIDRDKRYQTVEVQSGAIFNKKIEELILNFESSFIYNSSFFDGTLKINLAERDEKHITKPFNGADEIFFNDRSEIERKKNNNSVRATISFFGNFKLSRSDRIILSLYHNKLRYDTPSQNNDDDRDELLTIFRLSYLKDLSPFFQIFINSEATISHVVYLFASRSSNNNVNDVLRLSAGGYYRGVNVSSLNTFEVSANYTIFDFEDRISNLRSFSFRQFTATDSSSITLSKKMAFIITGYIKLSENADLNWGEFSERPVRFLSEIFADLKIVHKYNKLFLGAGVRYFSLNTFSYNGLTRVPDTKFSSVGPLIEILYNVYNSLYLKIDGWYEFISINDTPDRERANFTMAMNWNF